MPRNDDTGTVKGRRGARAEGQGTRTATPARKVSATATGTIDVGETLAKTRITWGLVSAYSVDAERLMIKLNVSAIRRILITVQSDAAQFRSAVSMTMLAHHNTERISVKYVDDPRRMLGADGLEVYNAVEVGIGEDALDIEDWPFKYTG